MKILFQLALVVPLTLTGYAYGFVHQNLVVGFRAGRSKARTIHLKFFRLKQ